MGREEHLRDPHSGFLHRLNFDYTARKSNQKQAFTHLVRQSRFFDSQKSMSHWLACAKDGCYFGLFTFLEAHDLDVWGELFMASFWRKRKKHNVCTPGMRTLTDWPSLAPLHLIFCKATCHSAICQISGSQRNKDVLPYGYFLRIWWERVNSKYMNLVFDWKLLSQMLLSFVQCQSCFSLLDWHIVLFVMSCIRQGMTTIAAQLLCTWRKAVD